MRKNPERRHAARPADQVRSLLAGQQVAPVLVGQHAPRAVNLMQVLEEGLRAPDARRSRSAARASSSCRVTSREPGDWLVANRPFTAQRGDERRARPR